jgi:hypothetical protein
MTGSGRVRQPVGWPGSQQGVQYGDKAIRTISPTAAITSGTPIAVTKRSSTGTRDRRASAPTAMAMAIGSNSHETGDRATSAA